MFFPRRPSVQDVERFMAESRELPLSYEPIGLSKGRPNGFNLDEQVTVVGFGDAVFVRATAALREWRHFDLGWVELFPRRVSHRPGDGRGLLHHSGSVLLAVVLHGIFNAAPGVLGGFLADVEIRSEVRPDIVIALCFLAVGLFLVVATRGRVGRRRTKQNSTRSNPKPLTMVAAEPRLSGLQL